jgi:DNA-binding SARP family transcriptional activator
MPTAARPGYASPVLDYSDRLSELLGDAILLAEASRDESVLRHLCGAQVSLRESRCADVPIRIDLLSGRVFAHGVPVPLSRAELALTLALALNARDMPRDVLADTLYPDADPVAAVNAVKVNVHRVRRRLSTRDVICQHDSRYALGPAVDVDLPRLEREVRMLRFEHQLTSSVRNRLEDVRRRVRAGRPGFMLEWNWFDDAERRLRAFTRDLTALLARDALNAEQYQVALDLATELTHDDPLDETGPETAIRAFLLAGNHAAAVLEYRRYASTLRREVNVHPSKSLRALVDES